MPLATIIANLYFSEIVEDCIRISTETEQKEKVKKQVQPLMKAGECSGLGKTAEKPMQLSSGETEPQQNRITCRQMATFWRKHLLLSLSSSENQSTGVTAVP